MSDQSTAGRSRRGQRLLVCGFGSFPGVADNPAAAVVERLRQESWAPERTDAAYAVLPTTWGGAVETCAETLRQTGADAVLILGVAAQAASFRVEMRARNQARADLPDAVGACHPGPRISALGPAVARAAVPVELIVAALEREGLPVHASSDAGDYLCNYTFYRLLTEIVSEPGSPVAAFLHLPPVRGMDVAAGLSLDDLERGVKAAASLLARTLASGPQAATA